MIQCLQNKKFERIYIKLYIKIEQGINFRLSKGWSISASNGFNIKLDPEKREKKNFVTWGLHCNAKNKKFAFFKFLSKTWLVSRCAYFFRAILQTTKRTINFGAE